MIVGSLCRTVSVEDGHCRGMTPAPCCARRVLGNILVVWSVTLVWIELNVCLKEPRFVGTVTYRQELRGCGKGACRRCREGPVHGPYWYAYWRDENGRLRKRYCGKELPADAVKQAAGANEVRTDDEPPPLSIRVFGRLEVQREHTVLTGKIWPRVSARRLLALLVLHPSGLPREEVGEILWPERPSGVAETNLRSALSSLRAVLEPHHPLAKSRRLPAGERLLRLHLGDADWVDLHVFSDATRPDHLDTDALSDRVSLYQGELLPEFRYDDWAISRRESLRIHWHTLSMHLAHRLVESGRNAAAIERLEAVLADDGTHEEAVRLLMTVLASQGRRSDALHVYGWLVKCMEREFGVAPDDLSCSLVDALRRDDLPVPSMGSRTAHEVAGRVSRRIERISNCPKSPVAARRLARLWAYRAIALERHGDSEEALSSVESGYLVIDHYDFPVELSRLLIAASQINCHQGKAGSAQNAAQKAEQLARGAGELGLAAWALRLQAQAAQQLGKVEQAIDLARSSTALYDAMGAREHALRSRRIVALNVWYAGRHGEAEILHRHNLLEARAIGDTEQQAYVLCGLGSALRAQGQLEAAETYLLEALALATHLEEHFLILSIEYHLANLWTDYGDAIMKLRPMEQARARREAQRRFERVMHLAQESQSNCMLVFGAVDLAVALVQWGRSVEARPLLVVALHALEGLDESLSPRAWTFLAQVELAFSEHDLQLAQIQIRRAIPFLEIASPSGLAQAHRLAAVIETCLGDLDAASSHWSASLGAARRCGQDLEKRRTEQAMERSERS